MLPTPSQLLLLKAALLDGDDALAAFAAWRGTVDLDTDVDGGSFRLLPLAYGNLVRLGCTDPVMRRLKGVYRHSWCETQARHHAAGGVLADLGARDIPVMLLKGAALTAAYYDGAALRPMSDLDLLVPRDRLKEAVATLEASGWAMLHWGVHPPINEANIRYAFRRNHAMTFRESKDRLLDLHWLFFEQCVSRSANESVWAAARPVEFAGRTVLRPSAEDLLLQVCAHGLIPNPFPTIRWIADAVMILRREGGAFGWDRLVEQTRRSWVSERVRVALAYLVREFAIDVPPDVDSKLRAGFRSRLERFDAGTAEGGLRLTEIARWSMSDRVADVPFLMLQFARNRLRLPASSRRATPSS